MSRQTQIKCDGVGCQHTRPEGKPEGWFRVEEDTDEQIVVTRDPESGDPGADLCSAHCLVRWVAKWAAPAENGKETNDG